MILPQSDAGQSSQGSGTRLEPIATPIVYQDGRPSAKIRLEARDQGVIFRHGSGPSGCDSLGARDVWVWRHGGTLYMHYDGAGAQGWLACLATSRDLKEWKGEGPALGFGRPGTNDAASASYGVTFRKGRRWHMFYMGTPNTSPPPDLVPAFPYLTMKAESRSPRGPWRKRYDIVPFRPAAGTYYSVTASPGQIIPADGSFLMFFSASTDRPILRTIGIARTKDLDGSWSIDREPVVSPKEQVENTSLYFDAESHTWFMFTNHVGVKGGMEYTDAIWVYWSKTLEKWEASRRAVVLDGKNCTWSKEIIGLPSIVRVGDRLAIFYDGYGGIGIPEGGSSHMHRDIGLAWLDLPLHVK